MSGLIGNPNAKSGINQDFTFYKGTKYLITDHQGIHTDAQSYSAFLTVRREENNAVMRLLAGGTATDSSQVWIEFMNGDGSGSMGYIGGSGSYNATFVAWSDERLKKDITDLGGQLALIRQLKPRNFKYKIDNEATIGFIAQEVQSIFPESVSEEILAEDGEPALTLNGWSKTDCRIVKAIQELADENDSLKTENTALKSRMDALEARITALEG